MRQIHYFFYIIFCLFLTLGTNSCFAKKIQKQLPKAKELYRTGDVQAAYNLLLPLYDNDVKDVESLEFLITCTQELNIVAQEILFQKHLFGIDQNQYRLQRLGTLFYSVGEYRSALDSFQECTVKSNYSQYLMSCCEFAISEIENTEQHRNVNLGLKTDSLIDEYWPMLSPDGETLFFTKLLNEGAFYYEKLFIWDKTNDSISEFPPFSLMSQNVGAVSFSPDGQYAFFTGCGNRRSGCDIYFSMLNDGQWSLPLPVLGGVNSNGWESQPSASLNAEQLYFVSERAGGCGKLDVWCASKESENEDGYPVYGSAKNLGSQVNTANNDFSPTIHPDGRTLYYSSDGRLGFGGADLYHTVRRNTSWSTPENLGYPINMYSNDEGITFSMVSDTVYFSSDRSLSKDIYQSVLSVNHQADQMIYLEGFLLSDDRCDTLNGVIEFIHGTESNFIKADKKYGYRYCLPYDKFFQVNIGVEGFLFYSDQFASGDFTTDEVTHNDFILSRIMCDQMFEMKNILFESASSSLVETSYRELDNLITFLELNSSVRIEIIGHTDNRGSHEYNQQLSESRAFVVARYLQRTIAEDRITWRGEGENIHISNNDTEEGRAKNRRTVVRITSE